MDEPARKRRRTNSPEERDRQSSPLRKPPRRPSFASPTKASLARNYPNLLPPTSARREGSKLNGRGPTPVGGKQAHPLLSDEAAQQATEDDTAAGAQQQNSPTQNGAPRAEKTRRHKRGAIEGERAVGQTHGRPRAPIDQNHSFKISVDHGDDGEQDQIAKTLQPLDLELERKKQEKARLQRQAEELEAQVTRCTEEIVKEQQRTPDQSLAPSERSALNDFIAKVSGAGVADQPPTLISSALCSFLPFSALAVPPPRPTHEDKPVASHRPLDLKDPLPFLEMFTSFKFSTRLGLPRSETFPSSKRVHQKHTIDIVGPQKLLTGQISIVIDTLVNEIVNMYVLRLPQWTEWELGTFVRGKAKEMDLGNACWAIESYWNIAQKRAQHWHKCETAFAHLLVGHDNEDQENDRPQAKAAQNVSRKDLNRHLGRDTLVLQDEHVLLKLSWRISFDWTGEASSYIVVESAVPQVWQEADATGSLKKIPETFASLLKSRGAYEATRIMVDLLFAR